MNFNLAHQYILASSSIMRQRIIKQLELPFTVIPSNIDESRLEDESPKSLVTRLGKRKCDSIMQQYPDAVVIGGDQVIILDNEILGKPTDKEHAFEQLSKCSGNLVRSLANVSVGFQGSILQKTITCKVKFRELSQNTIESYIKSDSILKCAGSLSVENLGILLIESIESVDPFAIYGMPLIALTELFSHHGLVDL